MKVQVTVSGKLLEKTVADAEPGTKIPHFWPNKDGHVVSAAMKDGVDIAAVPKPIDATVEDLVRAGFKIVLK